MRQSIVALLLLTSLSACRPSGEAPRLHIETDTGILNHLPRVQPSRKDTCETLKQVARQESYIQTVQQKREVVVVARCGEAPSQKVAAR